MKVNAGGESKCRQLFYFFNKTKQIKNQNKQDYNWKQDKDTERHSNKCSANKEEKQNFWELIRRNTDKCAHVHEIIGTAKKVLKYLENTIILVLNK